MDVDYADIVSVELKHNIFIPNEWLIQGIENHVLYLVEKIIMDPGPTTCILEINNIPAKLSRRPTESGCVYVFQKMSQEDVKAAHLHDVVLPIDDHSITTEIASGENHWRGCWPNYCVNASPRDKVSYHMPPYFKCNCKYFAFKKKLRTTSTNDSDSRRCILRSIKRLFPNVIIILLVLFVIASVFVLLFST